MSNTVLTLAQLQRGYQLSIDNAMSLLGASTELLKAFPDKALGLAQLGQEEIGKSYRFSLLELYLTIRPNGIGCGRDGATISSKRIVRTFMRSFIRFE